MNNIKVATQIVSLKVLILAEAAKEYEATWLKDAKTVLRDGTGRFAKKGNSTESNSSSKEDSVQVDAKSISKSLRSSAFRREAGLSPGAAMDTVVNNIYGAKKDDSSFMDKFNELHDEIADELSEFFGKDNPELGKSIKKGGVPLPKNDSLDNFLEFAIARYKICVDKLKKVTEESETPQSSVDNQKLLGETVNSAIPVAISVAIATLPSTLLPALAEGKFNWKTVLLSAVIGQAANFAAQKGLDTAGINDPMIRDIASLVAGILAGGIIGGKMKIKKTKQSQKIADSKMPKDAERTVIQRRAAKFIPLVTINTYSVTVGESLVKLDFTKVAGRRGSFVFFSVNNSFSVSDAIPPREKAVIALKLKKMLDAHIAQLPDGAILRCEAWADKDESTRIKAYKAMGFGFNEATKEFTAVVKGGN